MAAAKQAHVKLAGRFPVGAEVDLVKVRDERVLRTSAGDKVVASATVSEDGTVEFKKGVEVGGRYFVRGHVDGTPREVRITGTESASAVLAQPPVGNDEVKLGSGKTLAEHAAEKETLEGEVHPGPKQSHARDIGQASATPVGIATPVELPEALGSGRQEDADDGKLPQRSDTPHGVTTPIAPQLPGKPAKKTAAKKPAKKAAKKTSARKRSR